MCKQGWEKCASLRREGESLYYKRTLMKRRRGLLLSSRSGATKELV